MELLTTNSYCDRAWPEPLDDTELLSLYNKVQGAPGHEAASQPALNGWRWRRWS
jgi:hypothetical protein